MFHLLGTTQITEKWKIHTTILIFLTIQIFELFMDVAFILKQTGSRTKPVVMQSPSKSRAFSFPVPLLWNCRRTFWLVLYQPLKRILTEGKKGTNIYLLQDRHCPRCFTQKIILKTTFELSSIVPSFRQRKRKVKITYPNPHSYQVSELGLTLGSVW